VLTRYAVAVSLAPSDVTHVSVRTLSGEMFPSPELDNAFYAELKQRVRDANLLRGSPGLFLFNVLWTSFAVAAGIYLLSLTDNTLLLLAGAVLMAIVITHVSYIGHDAGHRQIFATPKHNDYVSLFLMPFVGFSGAWWRSAHNAHHANPNHAVLDPNLRVPILAFTEQQYASRRFTRFQAFYYIPMIAFEILAMHFNSFYYLARVNVKYRWAELAAMFVFFGLQWFVLLSLMTPLQAIAFFIVHELAKGLCLGAVFAPNHKGMDVVDDTTNGGFLWRQLVTTRNVRPNYAIDFIMGGLNYPTEHHLFPTVPRVRLRQLRVVVKGFCEEKNLPYFETGLVESYADIYRSLRFEKSTVLTQMPDYLKA
jgi:fatty acid desaturase